MAQCALSPKKVLVIGLDGATFYLLLPLLQKGELPFFSNFLKDGVYTTLQSTIPMFTPTAWSSFMTGKNPGKHGVIGFFARESNSYNTITSTSRRRGEDIWTILSKNGKKVVVINVPFTYPPKEVNGCMISGSETKSEDFVYPSS
ncbi:MAG: alkaline phosphatase family protein, partial [Candidatus Methylarchaceae archaeon HK02M1]|nr:alkaline phosphatase family protein [Candidatus Methylarchaceae archaeon HK02M1]